MKFKSHEEQIARRCKNFNGVMNELCAAGVRYEDVKDKSKTPYTWPCFKDEVCANVCDKAVFPTPEEVKAEVEESNSRIKQTVTAMSACMADAKVKGLKRGNGGKDSIPCPVCKTGRLHYSVSGYNGHLWGQCDTKDCVSWMQ